MPDPSSPRTPRLDRIAWQAGSARLIRPWRCADPRRAAGLDAFDPSARPLSQGDGDADKLAAAELAEAIAEQQALLWAGRRQRVLVVLQGMDASGKDGAIRRVFGRCGLLGTRALGWRAPSEQERSHDPLWRIHAQVPADGELVIFNRSHYEDAIEPAVHAGLRGEALARRCRQLNDFERLLTDTGTLVLKFFLHVSRQEQASRLAERRREPAKRWKADPLDLDKARHWRTYAARYAEVLQRTGTPWAPWYIVPADAKPHRDLMIGRIVLDSLTLLRLRPPAAPMAPGAAPLR